MYDRIPELTFSNTNVRFGIGGLLYLGRSEANAIPHVLVAKAKSNGVRDGIGDDEDVETVAENETCGYYSDGAYVALPPSHVQHSSDFEMMNGVDGDEEVDGEENEDRGHNTTQSIIKDRPNDDHKDTRVISAQEAYNTRLKSLFLDQRRLLHTQPSASAIRSLLPNQLISLPSNHRRARKEWTNLLQTTIPSPVQLAVMDNDTVLQALQLITMLLRRRRDLGERMSAWIWGLLGRLDDVGMLTSEEVSVVRELGKKAAWIMKGFEKRDDAVDAEGAEVDDENENKEEQEEEGEGEEEEMEEKEKDGEGDRKEVEDAKNEADSETNTTQNGPTGDAISSNSAETTYNQPVSAIAEPSILHDKDTDLEQPVTSTEPNAIPQQKQHNKTSSSPPPPPSSPQAHPSSSNKQENCHRRNTSSPPIEELSVAKARLLNKVNTPDTSPTTLPPAANANNTKELSGADVAGNVKNDNGDVDSIVTSPSLNTRVTLGTILTVVGEFYGQRDLLDFREEWV